MMSRQMRLWQMMVEVVVLWIEICFFDDGMQLPSFKDEG